MEHLLQRDYPPTTQGYDTLTLPSAFIPYCFSPNCPTTSFPYSLYDSGYANMQRDQYGIGFQRYVMSRQPQYDYASWAASPVFNSNMDPLRSNFMKYDTVAIGIDELG